MLYDAITHMPLRRDTDVERRAAAAARSVGDVDGWIVVDGRLCYVRHASRRPPAILASQTLRASIIAEMRRR